MALRTLPDYLDYELRLLSIGLNPSLPSVAMGFYFANPRNRFWRALNASRLLKEKIEPGSTAMRTLFERESIGYTDLVKRPTANASSLRANDYREGARRLDELLAEYRPRIAWFHGKLACGEFLKRAHPELRARLKWGEQDFRVHESEIFVTPNPSPANATFSLEEIVTSYNLLATKLGN